MPCGIAWQARQAATAGPLPAPADGLPAYLSPQAAHLLVGVSVYREPIGRNAVLFQIGELGPGDGDLTAGPASETVPRAASGPGPAAGPVLGIGPALAPRAPYQPPANLAELVSECEVSGLLTVSKMPRGQSRAAGDIPPVFVEPRTAAALHRELLATGRGDEVTHAHHRAAEYWQWRATAWPQDQDADVHDLLEARYHQHEAGGSRQAIALTELICSQLHAWGQLDREAALIRETMAWLPAKSPQRASWIQEIGKIAQVRGDYTEARRRYQQSLEIYTRSGDASGVSRSHHLLGVLAQAQGDYAEAEQRYQQSSCPAPSARPGRKPGLGRRGGPSGGSRLAQALLRRAARGSPPAARQRARGPGAPGRAGPGPGVARPGDPDKASLVPAGAGSAGTRLPKRTPGRDRPSQDRASQDNTRQGSVSQADQDRTLRDQAGKDRPGQSRPGQSQPGQSQPGQDQPHRGQSGTGQAGTGQSGTGQTGTGQTDPSPAIAGPPHAGLSKGSPSRASSLQGNSTFTGGSHAGQPGPGPAYGGPAIGVKPGAGKARTGQAYAGQPYPGKTSPGQDRAPRPDGDKGQPIRASAPDAGTDPAGLPDPDDPAEAEGQPTEEVPAAADGATADGAAADGAAADGPAVDGSAGSADAASPLAGEHPAEPGLGRGRVLLAGAATLASAAALVVGIVTGALPGPQGAHRPAAAAATRHPSTASPAPGNQGSGTAAARIRAQTAAWAARHLSRGDVVTCDPAMCSALLQHGFPAGNLLTLNPSANLSGGDVVIATAAVRNMFGARLTDVFAPEVEAAIGSGSIGIQVRVIAPDGARAYRAALGQDIAARRMAGTTLARNSRITATPAARHDLTAGRVDSRLLTILPPLANEQPVHILSFGADPGASPGMPMCSMDISLPVHRKSHGPPGGRLHSALVYLAAQQPPYLAMSERVIRRPGQPPVLKIEFGGPSPLGLLAGGSLDSVP